jgi:hypothetical protein
VESKWFGETPKLIEAVFRVARAHAPCVMFVDEIDGFLATRQDADMAHVNTMKTKFMDMWDGLAGASGGGGGGDPSATGHDKWVLVVGATNKPWALDPAVLRRMPRQIFVGLPDASARASILGILLRHERTAAGMDLAPLAAATEGYSGSDLKELVRAAALIPIREAYASEMRSARGRGAATAGAATAQPRPLTAADVAAAMDTVKPTGHVARSYRITHGGTFARPGAAAGAGAGATPAVPHRPATTPKGSSPGDSEAHALSATPAPDGSAAKPQASVSAAFMTMGPSTRLNSVLLSAALEAAASGGAGGARAEVQ